MKILYCFLIFYAISFIISLFYIIYKHHCIQKCHKQASKLLYELYQLNEDDIQKRYREYNLNKLELEEFKKTNYNNLDLNKFYSEYYVWENKALEYMTDICYKDDIYNLIKYLKDFKIKSASYKEIYNIRLVFIKTLESPSFILFHFIKVETLGKIFNFITLVVIIITSIIEIYTFMSKFIN